MKPQLTWQLRQMISLRPALIFPGSWEAVDKQAEKRNIHTDEEHCVHDLEATDPSIGTGFKTAHPSEDSFREKEATASVPPLY